ncbi:zinc finger protein 467-like [Prionailurus viverrinus]|uniref:zinc finger protein 467-like n=1 Tax=Prionailurus viverrinus TaxID=61388 RepID=UPI001FF2669D|nr:zinc finger protein 467-like [Prionailurus viverrinus]
MEGAPPAASHHFRYFQLVPTTSPLALLSADGDGIENRTLTSKQKHCPQELPRTDPRAGNENQVARPTGETANRTGKHARSPQTGSGRDDQPGERGQGGSSVWEILQSQLQPTQAPVHPQRPQALHVRLVSQGLQGSVPAHSPPARPQRGEAVRVPRVREGVPGTLRSQPAPPGARRRRAALRVQRVREGLRRRSPLFKRRATCGEGRPCGCPHCGRVFRSRLSLPEHRRAPGGQRGLACEGAVWCGGPRGSRGGGKPSEKSDGGKAPACLGARARKSRDTANARPQAVQPVRLGEGPL